MSPSKILLVKIYQEAPSCREHCPAASGSRTVGQSRSCAFTETADCRAAGKQTQPHPYAL